MPTPRKPRRSKKSAVEMWRGLPPFARRDVTYSLRDAERTNPWHKEDRILMVAAHRLAARVLREVGRAR